MLGSLGGLRSPKLAGSLGRECAATDEGRLRYIRVKAKNVIKPKRILKRRGSIAEGWEAGAETRVPQDCIVDSEKLTGWTSARMVSASFWGAERHAARGSHTVVLKSRLQ